MRSRTDKDVDQGRWPVLWPLPVSLLGAALLSIPARYYSILQIECTGKLSLAEHLVACTAYLLAVTLLGAGWLGMLHATVPSQSRRSSTRPVLGLGKVLALGACVNLVALIGLPFLSGDSVYYAALGRAAARFHASPYARLCDTLPAGDPFLNLLPNLWRCGTSAYGPGFNSLASLVAQLAGDNLTYQLRLFQLLGLLALLFSAALAGLAMRATSASQKPPQQPAEAAENTSDWGAWAAALVLFSPLAVIEGTANAHNDSFLALSVSGFVFCISRRRLWTAGGVLFLGLLFKLSALLLFTFFLLREANLWRKRLSKSLFGLALCTLILGAAVFAWKLWPTLSTPASALIQLLGSPKDEVCYCTRSVECLPRAFLHFPMHARTASWIVGLCFRFLGGVWLLYAAYRSAFPPTTPRTHQNLILLRWAATFFFIYYLFLHGYMQSWYLLPLLPLLPYLPERWQRSAKVLCVGAVAYYAIYLPTHCAFSFSTPVLVGISEVSQAAIVLLPPAAILLIDVLRSSAESP